MTGNKISTQNPSAILYTMKWKSKIKFKNYPIYKYLTENLEAAKEMKQQKL